MCRSMLIKFQARFMLGNNTDTNNSLWWVPLTYTSQDKLNFDNTQPTQWLKAEPRIELSDLQVAPNHWVLFNIKQTGETDSYLFNCNRVFL